MNNDVNIKSLYDGLASYTSHLYEIGQIRENSYAHYSSEGHFINTGGTWSAYGVQKLANLMKGHSEEELVTQIEYFTNQLFVKMSRDLTLATTNDKNVTLQTELIMEMRILSERIEQAINGIDNSGGLQGLIKTYQKNPSFVNRINQVIKELKVHQQMGVDIAEERLNDIFDNQPQELEKAVVGDANKFYEMLQEENFLLPAESVGILKYALNYTGALYFNIIQNTYKNYDWSNKIGHFENADLILGALPIQSAKYDSLAEMKGQNIEAVLSVIEAFENRSFGKVVKPITPEQLSEVGIKQVQLLSPDFETLPLELVERGVQFIHDNLANGKNVYVHCKAGRGRSALVVMCYLIKHQQMSAQQAFALVRKQRPQAGFRESESKYTTLLEYEAKYAV